MKMDNAGMAIQEFAYITRLEGVKKETNVIFTTREKETAMAGLQIQTSKEVQTLTLHVI